MKRTTWIAALATAAVLSLLGTAHATPVSLTLTLTAASTISLQFSALSGSVDGSVATSLSGTQDITLYDCDPISGALSWDGGDISISDTSLLIVIPLLLGQVGAALNGAHLTGLESSGQIPLNYTGGSWNYTLDPGDNTGGNVTSAGIDSGLLTYSGSGVVGSLIGSGTLDFANEPLSFDLPPLGQVATLTQTLLGITGVTTSYRVVISAPITFAEQVITDPVDVNATINGAIVATGTYICVPEPSTLILLGAAIVGLVPFYRRLTQT